MLYLHQPCDAMHQHTGFTGASAGQDQLTAHGGGDRLALGIVERIKQKGEVIMHSGILGCGPTLGKRRLRPVRKTVA